MSSTASVKKLYQIRKDFVFEGQNVYRGDYLDVKRFRNNKEIEAKLSGLIRRGFLHIVYETPVCQKDHNFNNCHSECIEEKIAESGEYEVQPSQPEPTEPTQKRRKTKHVDIGLKDQQLVDQADRVIE